MVSFFCPFCKHVIKASEDAAGTLTTCEQCKLDIRVPHSAAPLASHAPVVERAEHSSWWKRIFDHRNGKHPNAG